MSDEEILERMGRDIMELTKERDKYKADADRLAERLSRERDGFYAKALEWRGIQDISDVCKKCGGAGSIAYSSTATWHGGIGGQAMTVGVCDSCWGSGSRGNKWPDLRRIYAALADKEGKNG